LQDLLRQALELVGQEFRTSQVLFCEFLVILIY
jgi:hypothetical protein